MATSSTQTTITNPGASNAADFQPQTRNPQQQAGGQLFSHTSGLQPSTQEEILQNRDARITVPNNPAASGSEIAEARSDNAWLFLLLLSLALVMACIYIWRRRNKNLSQKAATLDLPIPDRESFIAAAQPVPPSQTNKKKPGSKSKSSKKKKRQRR